MAVFVPGADANFIGALRELPRITIQSDGSVVPQTEYVVQDGNVYSLRADLQQKYVLNISCSNIVFDGQGHVINGSGNVFLADKWIGYNCEGITIAEQTNVTIKNIEVTGFEQPGIYVYKCSGISMFKVQAELTRFSGTENRTILTCKTPIDLMDSNNSVFCKSTLGLGITNSKNNLIYMNDISSVSIGSNSANFWDNGSVGNYWRYYLVRYPDASEIGGTGIADTPYVINEDNVDSFPLLQLVQVDDIRTEEPQPSTQDSQEAKPLAQDSWDTESFLIVLAGGVSAVLIAAVIAVFVYRKRHNAVETPVR
jgi:hypothetical protein